jgi:hypothetical protein
MDDDVEKAADDRAEDGYENARQPERQPHPALYKKEACD